MPNRLSERYLSAVLFFDGFAGLVVLGLWLFCLLDVITTDEAQVRNLPKLVWVFIVVLLFEIGAVAWLIAGRPRAARRARPRATPTNPDDDAEFLLQLRARAEEQRRKAAERKDDPPQA